MRKPELVRRLAKRSGVSKVEAADQLDRVVHEILSSLRRGQTASLPGLGKFMPGRKWDFQFEQRDQKRKARSDGK